MLTDGDSDRVAELIRETAAAELLPRFGNLAEGDVRQKRPGDVVTVADEAAERRLAVGLAKILPGVPVVGEEAVEKDPGLLDLIARPDEACWIVDPLDGTANFAAGRDRFAIIVCLVRDTVPVAGWILDVPRGHLAEAHRGEGAALDGRIAKGRAPGKAQDRPLIGYVGYRIIKEFERQLAPQQRARLGRLSTLSCAGLEYIEFLAGRADFNLYRMTKPWDHAAGALMMREAGGGSVQFNGAPYGPSQALAAGLISSPMTDALDEARQLLEAVQLPLLQPRAS
jgi:fructose-1,6-bisphosphatase/inositol monophosphatase family enzyme